MRRKIIMKIKLLTIAMVLFQVHYAIASDVPLMGEGDNKPKAQAEQREKDHAGSTTTKQPRQQRYASSPAPSASAVAAASSSSSTHCSASPADAQLQAEMQAMGFGNKKPPMKLVVFQERPLSYPEGSVEKIHKELSQQLTLLNHIQTMPDLSEFYPQVDSYDNAIHEARIKQIPNPPPSSMDGWLHDGRAHALDEMAAPRFGQPARYTQKQLSEILYEKAILEKKFQATQVKLWQAKYQALQRQYAKELAEVQPGAVAAVEGGEK